MRMVATTHKKSVGADLEVVAHALLVRGECALRGLVGRLVRREADIAVRAENLARSKTRLKIREQRLERGLHAILVHPRMGLPPVAVVVLLKLRVELGRGGRNALKSAHA